MVFEGSVRFNPSLLGVTTPPPRETPDTTFILNTPTSQTHDYSGRTGDPGGAIK